MYTEALRVLKFRELSLSSSSEDIHKELGNLMDESHASCRDLFECSCAELDELVSLAKQAGAWGSRLTGSLVSSAPDLMSIEFWIGKAPGGVVVQCPS